MLLEFCPDRRTLSSSSGNREVLHSAQDDNFLVRILLFLSRGEVPHYSGQVRILIWKNIRTQTGNCFSACIVFAIAAYGFAGFANAQAASSDGAGSPISQAIYPLSQVHRGLHGTAYTVFEGSKPEPFDVEILGVLRDAIGPGKDMILARLGGSKAEYDGVVAGMSGSPVYVDGKLLGAIGFRIGQFTKEPIAGITPIQQMLEVFNATSYIGASYYPELTQEKDSRIAHEAASSWTAPDYGPLKPIETPLVFDGFSPAAIQLFQQHFSSLGLTPVSGLGGASPDEKDPAPVVPGSAISAIIVSGDFNMAATCTVTYVDAKRLLACGHPITRFGDISLPMTKAVVVATVASSLDPMKIINTTETIGSFTQDRESGVLGVFGKPAQMIPVTLKIAGVPQPHTYHFAIAEHPRLTSGALIATIFQAMQDTNGYNDPSTYNLQGEITLDAYPPVRIDEWVASTAQQPASLAAAVAVAQRFDSIFSNPRDLPSIRAVTLTLNTLPGERSATLADAHVLNPTVHAGDRVTVEAMLHPYRQPQRRVRIGVQLPDTLGPGPIRLLVSDGTTLDHTLHLIPNPAAPPTDLNETISRLNELHATNRLYVTLLAPVPQATLQGHDLPGVPLTMANVLQPEEGGGGFAIDGETAIPLGSKVLDLALSGSHVITVNVRP